MSATHARPQQSWGSIWAHRPPGAIELGVVVFVVGLVSPLIARITGQSVIDEEFNSLVSHPIAIVVVALLLSIVSAAIMHFAVRTMLPFVRRFTNYRSINALLEYLLKMFAWMQPALGLGTVGAMFLGLLGIYPPQPYVAETFRALSFLCGGIAGIRAIQLPAKRQSR